MSLQLETYFFPKISIEANPGHDARKPYSLETSMTIHGEIEAISPVSLMSIFTIEIVQADDSNVPYDLTIRAVGGFGVDKDFFKGKTIGSIEANMLINNFKISILGMVYGATRELVASITGRQPWGMILLPVIYPAEADIKVNLSEDVRNLMDETTNHVAKRTARRRPNSPSSKKAR
jgi:hypothetical protein